MFRAAIFDLDGTLVDNMRFHGAAWMALCARHGLPGTVDTFEREYAGKKNEEILPLLFNRPLAPEELERLAEEKEEEYRRTYRPHLALVAGADPLLRWLRDHGVPLAIASAAPPKNRALALDGLALHPRFDAVIGAEQVPRGKPHPDLFLAAAQALGIPSSDCLAFEDAVNGIRSAKAAGMYAVGLTTSAPEASLLAAGADRVLADFLPLLPELTRLFLKPQGQGR